MNGNYFELNEQTMPVVEEIGRHMPGGFFIYRFTDAPGSITLSVARTAAFEDQSTLRFSVKDTGIGMDKGFLPRIFDPFSQEDTCRSSRYGSTGLGMAITKNIVELMNGTIAGGHERAPRQARGAGVPV